MNLTFLNLEYVQDTTFHSSPTSRGLRGAASGPKGSFFDISPTKYGPSGVTVKVVYNDHPRKPNILTVVQKPFML
jgi:hypothetical protein